MTTTLKTNDEVVILELKYCTIVIDHSSIDMQVRIWPEDEFSDEPAGVINIPLNKLKTEE